MAIDLGKGPAVERGPALIAVLLGKYAIERAAEKGRALLALADEDIGKALEPRQYGNESRPYGILEFLRLHFEQSPAA
jgi:hypothetical protein